MNDAHGADIELLYAVPFDSPVFVAPELLGGSRVIALASHQARIELPRNRDPAVDLALLPPQSAPAEFGGHLPNAWGLYHEQQPWVEVNAVLIVVPVRARLDFELSGQQIGGSGVQDTLQEVRDWFESFTHWLWALTAQSLDPANPDPKVVHRASNNIIFAARTTQHESLSAAGSPTLTVNMDSNGPWSERVIDNRVLDIASQRALGSVPLALEMIASARMAARRGDRRRTLIDAGTAAETALSRILKLLPTHQNTLGRLVTMAGRQGIATPVDTKASLVEPRNDAVHRGGVPPSTHVGRAIEITEQIVAMVENDLIRVDTLAPAHRPQRHDLLFIVPGTQQSEESID